MKKDEHFTFLSAHTAIENDSLVAMSNFPASLCGKEPSRNTEVYVIGGLTGRFMQGVFLRFLEPERGTGKLIPVEEGSRVARCAIQVQVGDVNLLKSIRDEGFVVISDLAEQTDITAGVERFVLTRLRALSDTAAFLRTGIDLFENESLQKDFDDIYFLLKCMSFSIPSVLIETWNGKFNMLKNAKGEQFYKVYSDYIHFEPDIVQGHTTEVGQMKFGLLVETAASKGFGLMINVDKKLNVPLWIHPKTIFLLREKWEDRNNKGICNILEMDKYLNDY